MDIYINIFIEYVYSVYSKVLRNSGKTKNALDDKEDDSDFLNE